jgi:hypothetical protein
MVKRPLALGLTKTTLWANSPWNDVRKTMQAASAILLIDRVSPVFSVSNNHKVPAFYSTTPGFSPAGTAELSPGR